MRSFTTLKPNFLRILLLISISYLHSPSVEAAHGEADRCLTPKVIQVKELEESRWPEAGLVTTVGRDGREIWAINFTTSSGYRYKYEHMQFMEQAAKNQVKKAREERDKASARAPARMFEKMSLADKGGAGRGAGRGGRAAADDEEEEESEEEGAGRGAGARGYDRRGDAGSGSKASHGSLAQLRARLEGGGTSGGSKASHSGGRGGRAAEPDEDEESEEEDSGRGAGARGYGRRGDAGGGSRAAHGGGRGGRAAADDEEEEESEEEGAGRGAGARAVKHGGAGGGSKASHGGGRGGRAAADDDEVSEVIMDLRGEYAGDSDGDYAVEETYRGGKKVLVITYNPDANLSNIDKRNILKEVREEAGVGPGSHSRGGSSRSKKSEPSHSSRSSRGGR